MGCQTLVFEDVPKNHDIVPVWKKCQSSGVYDEEKENNGANLQMAKLDVGNCLIIPVN